MSHFLYIPPAHVLFAPCCSICCFFYCRCVYRATWRPKILPYCKCLVVAPYVAGAELWRKKKKWFWSKLYFFFPKHDILRHLNLKDQIISKLCENAFIYIWTSSNCSRFTLGKELSEHTVSLRAGVEKTLGSVESAFLAQWKCEHALDEWKPSETQQAHTPSYTGEPFLTSAHLYVQ